MKAEVAEAGPKGAEEQNDGDDEVPLPSLKKRRPKAKDVEDDPGNDAGNSRPTKRSKKEKRAAPLDTEEAQADKGNKKRSGKEVIDNAASSFQEKDEYDEEIRDAQAPEEEKADAKAKEKVSPKTRENQHAKRRAKNRKKKGKAAKELERLREAKKLEKKQPEISAAYLQAWVKKDSEDTDKFGPEGQKWQFSRATQRWLLTHAFEQAKVDKDTFALLLKYLDGLRGAARDQLEVDVVAMVERKGALAPAAPEEHQGKKKKKKRKQGEEEAATTAGEGEAIGAEEVQEHKARLKRAKRIVAALEASAEAAAADNKAAAERRAAAGNTPRSTMVDR